MKKCLVVGGGVVGLCSAYYLAKAGHHVTVVDKSNMHNGCSYGNAGMIVPSHIIPLAQPGVISKGFRWMFNTKSPFYVRPNLSLDLLKWLSAFYKNANQIHVNNSKEALLNLSLMSKELYQDFSKLNSKLEYKEKGLLMLYRTEKVAEEEMKIAESVRQAGLNVDVLSENALKQLENNISTAAIGAVHYKCDAHISPNEFMSFLKRELYRLEVNVISGQEITSVNCNKNKVLSFKTSSNEFKVDEYVLAAGSWSPLVANMLGIKIKLLPAKGYSFNMVDIEKKPIIPSILCEGKVAITPMNNELRFAGTFGITNVKDQRISEKRIKGMVEEVNLFFPTLKMKTPKIEDVWSGLRPCTPTGLPIISKSSRYSNLTICTGHAMMGLSLGPASGKLVEQMISNSKKSIDISRFT